MSSQHEKNLERLLDVKAREVGELRRHVAVLLDKCREKDERIAALVRECDDLRRVKRDLEVSHG